MINRIPIGTYLFVSSPNGDMHFDFVSPKFCQIYDITEERFLRDPSLAFSVTHPEDHESLIEANKYATEIGVSFHWKGRFLVNEKIVWIEMNSEPTFLANGDTLWSGIIKDISERIQSERNLNQQNEKLKCYTDIIDKYVLTSTTDTDGIITDASEAFCKASGYSKEELIGQSHNIVKHPDTLPQIYDEMWLTIKNGKTWTGEILNRKKDGCDYWVDVYIEPVKDENGNIVEYTAIRHDITDKKRIEILSITDSLTKVFNRLKLDSILQDEFLRSERYGNPFSIIMLDIDNFKSVNDLHGHQVGDEVLINMANILQSNLRETDFLGRWGGEEFLIICPNIKTTEAYNLAEKLRVIIEKHQFPVVKSKTASFGVASYQSGESVKGLMIRADEALYHAKKNGRNRVEVSTIRSSS